MAKSFMEFVLHQQGGVKLLNDWRIENCGYPNSPIDLSGADLSGVNLMGADLRYANLVGVNLKGARWIEEANYRGATMDQETAEIVLQEIRSSIRIETKSVDK